MNKKNLERWEVRLGVAQVVIVLGVITGCMTFAFYLGFFAGKSAGFEFAMETNVTSAAKLPISGESVGDKPSIDITEQAVSDVYARLNEKAKKETDGEVGALEDVPSLGSIKESETAQEPAPSVKDVKPAASEASKVWNADEKTTKNGSQDVKVLGDDLAKAPVKVNPDTNTMFDESAGSHPIDKALDATEASKKLLKDEKSAVSEAAQENKQEVKKEVVKPTAVPPTPTPKKEEAKKEKEEVKKLVKNTEEGAAIIRGVIPKGWFAQVAAPTKLKDAEGIAEKLKKNGFRVVIETAKVRGDEYYRILVGPELNKSQAEMLVQQLKRESYLAGSPFIRMVK